jgi:hypothetical protein
MKLTSVVDFKQRFRMVTANQENKEKTMFATVQIQQLVNHGMGLLLVSACLFGTSQTAPAQTVCEVLRPNSNTNALWNVYTYTNIDDWVFKPGTPSSDAVSPDSDDDYEEQIWGFNPVSATSVASVSAVHVNIHAYDGHVTGDDPEIRIKVGGIWTSVQTAELEDGWYTRSFYGSWSVQDIDELQVGINPLQMNNTEEIVLDAIYCEVCGPEISSSTPTPTPSPTLTPTPN